MKASGEGEGIQDPAELGHRSHVASEQNEGVVGILENGVGDGRIDRVAKLPVSRCLLDEPLENTGYNDEQVGGDGVSLTEAAMALEPAARGAI